MTRCEDFSSLIWEVTDNREVTFFVILGADNYSSVRFERINTFWHDGEKYFVLKDSDGLFLVSVDPEIER